MAKKELLLDLETLIERPTITIDKKPYEILSPEELSILDSQRFTSWGARIEKLSQEANDLAEDALKENAEELRALVDKVVRKVLVDVPDDILAKLKDAQKLRVVEVFTMLLLRHRMGAAGAAANVMKGLGQTPENQSPETQAMNQSIGEKPSHGSSGSSEATPTGGLEEPRPSS